MSRDVSDLVDLALAVVERPYPPDVTDRVFLAIEGNAGWLRMYQQVVSEKGRHAVNSAMGRTVLQLTGLRNSGHRRPATSSLIRTYTELR